MFMKDSKGKKNILGKKLGVPLSFAKRDAHRRLFKRSLSYNAD